MCQVPYATVDGVPAACPIGRSTPRTHGHWRTADTPAHLRTSRLTRCANRPVTKLLASPVTVWNRRGCLRLAQRGRFPSDKPVGDRGGSLACSCRVSPIRGRHVSGMKSSNSGSRRDRTHGCHCSASTILQAQRSTRHSLSVAMSLGR
jgi:hypothetical protein